MQSKPVSMIPLCLSPSKWRDYSTCASRKYSLTETETAASLREPQNIGALKYRQALRRHRLFVAGALLAAAAGASGFLFAADMSPFGLSPANGIVFAVLLVTGLSAANWLYLRKADELARADYLKAAAFGMAVAVLLYPGWLILWLAHLLPQPDVNAIYWLTVGSFVLAYACRRIHHQIDRSEAFMGD